MTNFPSLLRSQTNCQFLIEKKNGFQTQLERFFLGILVVTTKEDLTDSCRLQSCTILMVMTSHTSDNNERCVWKPVFFYGIK